MVQIVKKELGSVGIYKFELKKNDDAIWVATVMREVNIG